MVVCILLSSILVLKYRRGNISIKRCKLYYVIFSLHIIDIYRRDLKLVPVKGTGIKTSANTAYELMKALKCKPSAQYTRHAKSATPAYGRDVLLLTCVILSERGI